MIVKDLIDGLAIHADTEEVMAHVLLPDRRTYVTFQVNQVMVTKGQVFLRIMPLPEAPPNQPIAQ
jgi:hypothetical protein